MNFPKAKYPTRYVFAQRMTERGATDSEFVVFESDLAKSTYSYLFREKYPERYFDMGIAEIGTVASAAVPGTAQIARSTGPGTSPMLR